MLVRGGKSSNDRPTACTGYCAVRETPLLRNFWLAAPIRHAPIRNFKWGSMNWSSCSDIELQALRLAPR